MRYVPFMLGVFRVVAIVTLVLLNGCTGEARDSGGGAGGVATASALVVALPLIPFVEAYHAVSGDVRKDAQRLEQMNQELDPIYEKRSAIIEKLNPIEAAEQIHGEGIEAYLPQRSGFQIYPGLKNTDVVDATSNADKIRASELLSYLQTLTDDDPAQNNERYNDYYSPAYRHFRHLGSQYKVSFNVHMRELSKGT